jgi:flagellar basal body-associated protein FliL
VVTWTALGGAIAAGAVAGTFWLVSRSQYHDFETARQTYNDSHTQANHDSAANAANKVQRSQWIAIGCGIGAGALAVTALVTYLLNSGAEESKTTVSLSPFGLGVQF